MTPLTDAERSELLQWRYPILLVASAGGGALGGVAAVVGYWPSFWLGMAAIAVGITVWSVIGWLTRGAA